MHLLFSQERGCSFPKHLLDPEIGKKRALGSLGAFKCSHLQDPTAPPLPFILEWECGTARRSTAVLLWDSQCRDDQCSFLG